jgi:hypothetical protein
VLRYHSLIKKAQCFYSDLKTNSNNYDFAGFWPQAYFARCCCYFVTSANYSGLSTLAPGWHKPSQRERPRPAALVLLLLKKFFLRSSNNFVNLCCLLGLCQPVAQQQEELLRCCWWLALPTTQRYFVTSLAPVGGWWVGGLGSAPPTHQPTTQRYFVTSANYWLVFHYTIASLVLRNCCIFVFLLVLVGISQAYFANLCSSSSSNLC